MSLKICERERERERQYFKVSASATNFDERTKALPICRLEQVLEIQTSFFSRKNKGDSCFTCKLGLFPFPQVRSNDRVVIDPSRHEEDLDAPSNASGDRSVLSELDYFRLSKVLF